MEQAMGSIVMAEKASFLAKLEQIGKEYEEKLRPEEWVQSRLRWEDWGTLLPELVQYARREIRRRRWRGERSGVLPEGYDANSVAAEVITSALRGEARLEMGWTRERLMGELKRKVRNEVRRLHKRQEAWRTRSEWEILAPDGNGQPRSVFELIKGVAGGIDEARLRKLDRERKSAELMIAEKLRGGDELKLFNCLREGVVKRREIAARLGIGVNEVTNCRKRLNRRLEELGKAGCRRWVIEEWKAR